MNCDGHVIPLLSKELSLLSAATCNNAATFKGKDERGRDESGEGKGLWVVEPTLERHSFFSFV